MFTFSIFARDAGVEDLDIASGDVCNYASDCEFTATFGFVVTYKGLHYNAGDEVSCTINPSLSPRSWASGQISYPCILLFTRLSTCKLAQTSIKHDDVIKWKYFPRYWSFVRGIHRWPMNSPHKGPVTRKMFPFDHIIMIRDWCICAKYLLALITRFFSELLSSNFQTWIWLAGITVTSESETRLEFADH